MYNRLAKFGLKIPKRLGKMSENFRGIFLTHTVYCAVVIDCVSRRRERGSGFRWSASIGSQVGLSTSLSRRLIRSLAPLRASIVLLEIASPGTALSTLVWEPYVVQCSHTTVAQLLQPSLTFCFSLQPMTTYRPVLQDLFYVLLHVLFYLWSLL